MKRKAKLILFAGLALILVISAVLLVKYRRSQLAEESPPPVRPVPVHTAQAERGRLPISEHYIGTIEPFVYADLSPRATGHLRSVAGDAGDPIQTGETLAVLDPRLPKHEQAAIAEELKGAKAALTISEKVYERRQALIQKNHVSEEQLDETRRQYVLDQARVNRLKAELAGAMLSVEYTRLIAPFDGIITQRMKDPGDLVSPGTPLLRVENPEAGYKILVHIPQATANRLGPGDPVVLNFKGNEETAAINRIQPAISPGALAVLEIRREKKPFALPSGATIGVDVTISRPSGIVIPLSCLLEQEGQHQVFIVDPSDMTAAVVPVVLVGKSGSRAVVEGEIPKSARLVSGNESMLIQLGDGSPVQPIAPEDS